MPQNGKYLPFPAQVFSVFPKEVWSAFQIAKEDHVLNNFSLWLPIATGFLVPLVCMELFPDSP